MRLSVKGVGVREGRAQVEGEKGQLRSTAFLVLRERWPSSVRPSAAPSRRAKVTPYESSWIEAGVRWMRNTHAGSI